MSYIYLASPYSHKDLWMMEERYEATMKFAAEQMSMGVILFSPILHCHEMAKKYGLPRNHVYWRKYNTEMQKYASELWVLQLSGWKDSLGVAEEIVYADRLNQPIIYI